jgi:hypothetical protein
VRPLETKDFLVNNILEKAYAFASGRINIL